MVLCLKTRESKSLPGLPSATIASLIFTMFSLVLPLQLLFNGQTTLEWSV